MRTYQDLKWNLRRWVEPELALFRWFAKSDPLWFTGSNWVVGCNFGGRNLAVLREVDSLWGGVKDPQTPYPISGENLLRAFSCTDQIEEMVVQRCSEIELDSDISFDFAHETVIHTSNLYLLDLVCRRAHQHNDRRLTGNFKPGQELLLPSVPLIYPLQGLMAGFYGPTPESEDDGWFIKCLELEAFEGISMQNSIIKNQEMSTSQLLGLLGCSARILLADMTWQATSRSCKIVVRIQADLNEIKLKFVEGEIGSGINLSFRFMETQQICSIYP